MLGLVADRAASALGAAAVRGHGADDRPPVHRARARRGSRRSRSLVASSRRGRPDRCPDTDWFARPAPRSRAPCGPASSSRRRDVAASALRPAHAGPAARQRRPAIARAHARRDSPTRLPVRPASREAQIEQAIDDEGTVRDQASPLLRRLRRELRGAEGELDRAARADHGWAGGAPAGLGRWFGDGPQWPIRHSDPARGKRAIVGGIVQDTSATGATLFVEPPAAVEAGNRIRELEAEERARGRADPARADRRVRPLHTALGDGLDALCRFRLRCTRARASPTISDASRPGARVAARGIRDSRWSSRVARRAGAGRSSRST